MNEIGVRELRNEISAVLRRAEAGESFVVTVRGRPSARVVPIDARPTTMPTTVFLAAVGRAGADPEMLDDIANVGFGTTDDVNPWSD